MKNFTTKGNKSSKKLITHSGSFHSDDIFAAATLSILLERKGEKFEIIRTRDEEIIKTGDYVFDVGGIYDEEKNLFDHHQIGGAGRRVPREGEGQGRQGIEYSSFGLVWKKYGKELAGGERAMELVDKILVAPIDAHDNGFDLVEKKTDISPFLIQDLFFFMQPTWRELSTTTYDEVFLTAVQIARDVLLRNITKAQDTLLAEELVLAIYEKTADKRILVLDKNYPYERAIHDLPEPLFVVYPRMSSGDWGVKAVREEINTFKNRKNLPQMWAGLRDEELQKVSGVPDAVFCHRALFMAVAKSKEGAIKLAQIALESE